MTPFTLFIVVLVQIAVFQVASIRMSESLIGSLLGGDPLPAGYSERVARFRRRMKREHLVMALALAVVALAAIAIPSLARGARKLTLAGASLASTGSFLLWLVRDARALTRIAADLPEPARRPASLERRSLGQFYPAWLEAVPFLIVLATVVLTALLLPSGAAERLLSAGARPVGRGELRAWIIPLLQATWVIAMLAVTFFQVRGSACFSRLRKGSDQDPERRIETDRRLRRMQLRHGFVSKTLATLLIGLIQIRRIVLPAMGTRVPALAVLEWVMVVGMLVSFAAYMAALARMQRTGDSDAAQDGCVPSARG